MVADGNNCKATLAKRTNMGEKKLLQGCCFLLVHQDLNE